MTVKTVNDQLRSIKAAIKTPLNALYLARPLSENQKEQVKPRVDGLVSELNEYLRYGSRFILRDNTLPPIMPERPDFKGRLRFLFDVIGEDEIQKRFERTVKAGINAPDSILDNFPIFKSGDIAEYKISGVPTWFKFHVISDNVKPRVFMKEVDNPMARPWENISQALLTSHHVADSHPEYFIRYLTRNKKTTLNKDDDFVVNNVLEELDEYVSESDKYQFSDYSLPTGKYINIKPRLQVLFDIIGKEELHKKLSKYTHAIEGLSDEELNKYSAFEFDDIVKYYDEKGELCRFIIGSGYPNGLFIHKMNDSLDYLIIPQSKLLRLNPEYFHRYLNAQKKDNEHRKKMKKLGIEC